MPITRRDFLKYSGITMGIVLCPSFLKDAKATSYAWKLKTREGQETTTICPFCAGGCGVIVTTSKGSVINIEGDSDHPVNGGVLCSKSNALSQIFNNERRLTKVLWRPPNWSGDWIELPWFLALMKMAFKIKLTRDFNWESNDGEFIVNRTRAIAALGGSALDNEECYLYTKLLRALGVVYMETQARI